MGSDMEDLVHGHGIEDGDSECGGGAHVNRALAPTSNSSNASSSSSICMFGDHGEIEHEHENEILQNNGQENDTGDQGGVGQVFEDFECNVQVESTESGEERKEFSFTFYDLEGHGKITKDDIAGLVRSIYGAVNDSITVPSGGKKTIKVKLSVAPNAEKNNNNNNDGHSINNNNNNNINNVKSQESGQTKVITPPPPPSQCSPTPKKVPGKRNNVNVTIRESTANNSNRIRRPKFNSVRLPPTTSACGHGHIAGRFYSPDRLAATTGAELYSGASPMRHRKKWRESFTRSTATVAPNHHRHHVHQSDLTDLLQANMEKNHVQPCCRQRQSLCYPPNFSIDNHHPHHGHLNNCTRPHCCPNTAVPLPNGSNHHRSRSHDLSHNIFKYHLLDHEAGTEGKFVNNQLNNGLPAPAPTSHQLKHKHREEDHARAMAQVINWLEREHISTSSPAKKINNHTHAHSRPHNHNHHHQHHVHEHQHIHHHFHHHFNSKETPIIV